MMLFSRWRYYLSSIPTLLMGFRNWPVILRGLYSRRPFEIHLQTGQRFWVRSLMDIWIIKETCLDHDYETHGIGLQDGWTVMDIGAGLGDFTVYAAQKLPNGIVYAYEPFPESYELLQKNLSLNAVHNARVFPYAIGAEARVLQMNTGTGVAVKHSTAAAGENVAVSVTGITLDEVFQSVEQCDFMKMDCEGAEYDILFHASPITMHKIRHLCMEYHDGLTPYTHQDLVEFLETHGFRVTTTPNPAHREIGFLYARR
ncbi:MAG: FkbM family methyltransferase [Anaerolineae bacterium]|nr:FkbM family methyltransferase [Anaerolineae bacterium]